MTITYPPITPIPQLDAWTDTLTRIASGPLDYCPDFPAIARRHEAFWANEAMDRPLFLASANKNPARPITRRLDLLDQPEAWFEAKIMDLEQTHRVGDTLPTVRVDFGAVILGAFIGADVEFESDTTWTHAIIDDEWSNAPDWTIRDDNVYWNQMQTLAQLAAERGAGRYVIMVPNIGASSDLLLNLRGSAQLCMDVVDQPDIIESSIHAIYPAWHKAFTRLYEIIVGGGVGITEYLGLWANQPYGLPSCDFNAMIGPRPFKRLFLPDIARQAATASRAIFHLDGPDASRHFETLLDVPELNAIQYVVGAGHSALPKLPMFQKIQASGKPLQILCAFNDVLPLCEALEPRGLAFLVDEVPGPAELDDLFAQVCARFA